MFDRQFMTPFQRELYQSIQAFELDDPRVEFPFSKHLAKENTWGNKYTQRAIEEYKKFMFLLVAAGHPVVASRQVERVWHLHLTYTQSYWNRFCLEVLGIPLHHEPFCGGLQESYLYRNTYEKTLGSYEQFFRKKPPADIWPPAEKQFKMPVKSLVAIH
jgi:hypothetical protein